MSAIVRLFDKPVSLTVGYTKTKIDGITYQFYLSKTGVILIMAVRGENDKFKFITPSIESGYTFYDDKGNELLRQCINGSFIVIRNKLYQISECTIFRKYYVILKSTFVTYRDRKLQEKYKKAQLLIRLNNCLLDKTEDPVIGEMMKLYKYNPECKAYRISKYLTYKHDNV